MAGPKRPFLRLPLGINDLFAELGCLVAPIIIAHVVLAASLMENIIRIVKRHKMRDYSIGSAIIYYLDIEM